MARTAERLLRAEDWTEVMPEVLADLGEATGVGRVYVFENHPGPEGELLHSMRWEWCAPGVEVTLHDPLLQDMPFSERHWEGWFARIAAGDAMFEHRSDEPDEGSRRTMEAWGIVSIAMVPVHVGEHWWGYMAYDDVEDERPWADGEIEALRAAAGILGAAIERRRALEARSGAEARYRALLEQIPSIVYAEYLDDDSGNVLGESYISPQVTTQFGYTAEEWLDVPTFWGTIVHPDDRRHLREVADASLARGDPWDVGYRIVTADGRTRWVIDEAILLRDEQGQPLLWQGVITDVTEAKEAEAERRRLLARVVEAQEQERRRIASDVHDDQIQKLTAVSLRLQTFHRHVHDDGAREDLDRLERSVGRAIEGLRHLLFELRPKLLDDAGLAAALGQYCRRAEVESGIEHVLDGELEHEPSEHVRGVAYRIAQEALTNARRHAAASRITVHLSGTDRILTLQVIDDGEGFTEPVAPTDDEHLGLSTMRERAELAGGSFALRSIPGHGTTVTVELPLAAR